MVAVDDVQKVRTLDSILEDAELLLAKAAEHWQIGNQTTSEASMLPASGTPVCNALHPLGPVDIDSLSTKLAEQLSEARDVLLQYRDATLPTATAAGPTGCATLRTYASLLKEETALFADVRRLRTVTRECQQRIGDACDDRLAHNKRRVVRLERIAKKHGLEFYSDESVVDGVRQTTVMLAGAVVVVDVESVGTESVEVRITYALSDESGNNGSIDSKLASDAANLDQLLTQTLRAGNMNSFERHVAWLARLDELSKDPANQVDFFHYIHVLGGDLESIFQREQSICSGDLLTVLLYGHGLPLSDRVQPGPAIAYWAPRALLIGTDWERLSRLLLSTGLNRASDLAALGEFHRIHLQLERSSRNCAFIGRATSSYLATKEQIAAAAAETHDMPELVSEASAALLNAPLTYIVPQHPCANAQCVAYLEPGIITTASVAARIAGAVGLGAVETLEVPASECTDATLSFFDALVHESRTSKMEVNEAISSHFDGRVAFRMHVYENSIPQEFAVVSGSPPAVVVKRIPFTHPCQLAELQRLVRQQLVFNALFKSCFRADTATLVDPATRIPVSATDSSVWAQDAIRVEVATHELPNAFLLSFLPPGAADYVCLEVSISAETALPSVKRLPAFNAAANTEQPNLIDAICHEQKMTEVIRTGESVPLLILWLLRRFEEQNTMDWVENTGTQ